MEANRGDLKAIQQMEPSGPDGGERAELGEPVKDCITGFRANGLVLVLKDGAFAWRASKYACLRFWASMVGWSCCGSRMQLSQKSRPSPGKGKENNPQNQRQRQHG